MKKNPESFEFNRNDIKIAITQYLNTFPGGGIGKEYNITFHYTKGDEQAHYRSGFFNPANTDD
jgi:hypothetical protein